MTMPRQWRHSLTSGQLVSLCCVISMVSTLTPGAFGMKTMVRHVWLWHSASGRCLDFRRRRYSGEVGASWIQRSSRLEGSARRDSGGHRALKARRASSLVGRLTCSDLTAAIDVNESLSKSATTCATWAQWRAIQSSWAAAGTRMAQYRNGLLSHQSAG